VRETFDKDELIEFLFKDDQMNKEKSNVKIKGIYKDTKHDDTYTVLLDNQEIWSIVVPSNILSIFDFSEYLGSIGIGIGSITDIDDRGRKISLEKIPQEIIDWLKKYNQLNDEG
jgi:hypothetical protein